MVEKATPEERKKWTEAFRVIDKNENGEICWRELKRASVDAGIFMTKEDAIAGIAKGDKNNSGSIDLEEFIQQMSERQHEMKAPPALTEAAIREVFKIYDQNGDGFITKSEIMKGMRALGDPISAQDINEIIKKFDVNKDGKLDFEEFAKMLNA